MADLESESTPSTPLRGAVRIPGRHPNAATSTLHTPSHSGDLTLSHSMPAARTAAMSASNSSNSIADLVHESSLFATYFAEGPPPLSLADSHSGTAAHTSGGLRSHLLLHAAPLASPSPTDWPRSGTTAIPIHPGRPRAGSHALPNATTGTSPASAYVGQSASPYPSGTPSVTPPLTPTLTGRQGPNGSPAPPRPSTGRSWSLIEHGRRFWNGGSTATTAAAAPTTASAHTHAIPIHVAPRPTPINAASVMSTSWSGGGVTHVPLPANLAAVNREGRARSQSFISPPSSALTSLTQAAGAVAPPSPLRTFLSCSTMPATAKTDVNRVLEYARELEVTIAEYKSLLSKLWTRRRQVLGTLTTSLARLQSWMQVAKMEVLQELITTQSDLFDREETMLRHACILLKEKQAAMSSGVDDMNAHLERLAASILEHPNDPPLLIHLTQSILVHFPSSELMDSLANGQSVKSYAVGHPLLQNLAAEQRHLLQQLEACKARYLTVTKQTEVEELQSRPARFKRVVATMVATQSKRAPPPPSASPSPAPSPVAGGSAPPRVVSPPIPDSPLLDHAPDRAIELDFARLLLDERSKEGRACAKLIAQLETLLAKKEAPSSSATSQVNHLADTLAHPLHELTRSNSAQVLQLPKSSSISSLLGIDEELAATHVTSASASPEITSTAAPDSSPLVLHRNAYEMVGSFLWRLENSLAKEQVLLPDHRPALRLLIQRTLFPRLWQSLLRLGYEADDLPFLPDLPEGLVPDETPAEGEEMTFRERVLELQLKWLRRVTPLELGVPAIFLKPPPTPTPTPPALVLSTPRTSFSSPSPALGPSPSLTSTPTRAPPTYKPSPPSGSPALAPVPWQPKPYRAVIDLFEEVGGLNAPADMVACILSASKAIYVAARKITDQAQAERRARGERDAKQEALGADSFFPIFLFVLIQSAVPSWLHRLKLMQKYALAEEDRNSEASYYLTTLEAALLFIQQATPANINPKVPQPSPKRHTSTGTGSLPNSSEKVPTEASTHVALEPVKMDVTALASKESSPRGPSSERQVDSPEIAPATAANTAPVVDGLLVPVAAVPPAAPPSSTPAAAPAAARVSDSASSHPLFSNPKHAPFSLETVFAANDL